MHVIDLSSDNFGSLLSLLYLQSSWLIYTTKLIKAVHPRGLIGYFLFPGSFNHVANDIRSPMVTQYFAGVPDCIDSEYLVTEPLPNFDYIFKIEVQHSIFIKPQ